jgi:DNA-binding Lrp family transcriptional regulator
MYDDFNGNNFIPIIQRADGYADVFVCNISRDIFHQNEILQNIFNKYGENIASSDIFVGLGFIKFPRSYLINKENEFQKFAISGGTKEKIKLPETDMKIVSLLLVDGRMEFKKIADILKVSPALIHKQYSKLIKAGVITKITYSINHQKLGILFYRVCIKIVQFNQTRVDDLYKFCCLHPNIINYIKGMGSWELLLEIEIESRGALRDLVREMKNQFKDIIRQIEINEIYKMDKFTQMAIEYPELKNNDQTVKDK